MEEGMLSQGKWSRQIWILCPRCKTGRWVGTTRVKSFTFTGLCSCCNTELAEQTYKPYRNVDKIRKIRRLIFEAELGYKPNTLPAELKEVKDEENR